MNNKVIYTIGHGNRNIEDFFELLRQHKIEFLIDVRSSPYSKMHMHYNKEPLSVFSTKHNIKYSYWGDSLGGRPKNEDLYLDDGKVDYNKIKEQENFKGSIERLISAYENNFKVVLMCSEQRPEDCHRSKLIGECLVEKNVNVTHIDEKGTLKSHNDVILKVTKGVNTKDLFGNNLLYSNGAYVEQIKIDFEFFTIGVYNSNKESFFNKLIDHSIDTFIDIRQRRGVRGSKYSYVNSNKLQEELGIRKINYLYLSDLAPTMEIREVQKEADKRIGVLKKEREFLGATFSKEYNSKILDKFDFDSFFNILHSIRAKKIVFFCIEESYTACHRSLVTKKLLEAFNYHSKHL